MREIVKKVPILGGLAGRGYHLVADLRARRRIRNERARQNQQEYRRIQGQLNRSPLRIVVGSSGVYDEGWIHTDAQYLNLLVPEHWERLFKKESIDAILAEHVWEHLTADEGLRAARQCFQYLKPGGYLRLAVPDGFHPSASYIEYVKVGGTGPGSDDHKVLYNYKTFEGLFVEAGYRVKLLEYFDEEGRFHFADWTEDGGKIHRSRRFDERNVGGELKYTSIILDAFKGARPDGTTGRAARSTSRE